MGDDTAASRLRLLREEFTAPAVRRDPGAPRSRATTPGLPVNLSILDHVAGAVEEIITHTRAEAPDDAARAPLPAEAEDIYDWAVSLTPHLEPERQRVRDALIYRQGLEHALAMGEERVVRREPCPTCQCWGLFWRPAVRRAVCVNQYCRRADGRHSTWTLDQLARQHVAAKTSRHTAT